MNRKIFGLIGRKLSHSYSYKFFSHLFDFYALNHCEYRNFELRSIEQLPALLKNIPNIAGFNITIPYKESIFKYLDFLTPEACSVGSVNVVKVFKNAITGYNTDIYGFQVSLKHFLGSFFPPKALILGTGGAAKAVAYVLNNLGIDFFFVSRSKKAINILPYEELTPQLLSEAFLIVNATPLGMYPDIFSKPPVPYTFITENHYCYDLVYNPSETAFMKECAKRGAKVKNGLEMLQLQAIRSFEIWFDRQIDETEFDKLLIWH